MTTSYTSGFQTPITIKEAMEKVKQRKFLLPMIQREFVWNDEQIVKLFDSLMREYPIGSFLFWEAQEKSISRYQFYEFVTSFSEMDNINNPKATITNEKEITCILDGQQRLSALYIGLLGSYAKKIPKRRWDNPDNFVVRKLFINLMKPVEDPGETGLLYDFRFLTEDEAKKEDENTSWFQVGSVLRFNEPYELSEYLIERGISRTDKEKAKFANQALYRLYNVIHKDGIINYFMEKAQDLDKVLNIFVRINSAGSPLDYSDLLLSIASAQWKTMNARDEIIDFVNEINNIGDGFNFDKDFVLKSCLILSDMGNIAFKVDNFNKKNMEIIEKKWDKIKNAVRLSVELVSSLGYNFNTLSSNNAVIPISYYIMKINSPANFVTSRQYLDDRKLIKKWLATSLIMRTFSGQPDDVLRRIRETMNGNIASFPFKEIQDKLRGTQKSLTVTDEDLDGILSIEYGKPYAFSTLALLYPTFDFRNKFHIDHIFPQNMFNKRRLKAYNIPEDKWDDYIKESKLLGNLQLLEGTVNEEKSSKDPKKWVKENYNEPERKEYFQKNLIPIDASLDFSLFLSFVADRKMLIRERLKGELGILK
jgi:uncharacterized protein with ParB-like and HNH nuclease domain